MTHTVTEITGILAPQSAHPDAFYKKVSDKTPAAEPSLSSTRSYLMLLWSPKPPATRSPRRRGLISGSSAPRTLLVNLLSSQPAGCADNQTQNLFPLSMARAHAAAILIFSVSRSRTPRQNRSCGCFPRRSRFWCAAFPLPAPSSTPCTFRSSRSRRVAATGSPLCSTASPYRGLRLARCHPVAVL